MVGCTVYSQAQRHLTRWPQWRLEQHPRSLEQQAAAAGIRVLPGQPPGEAAVQSSW